jgi:hypothetical protein
VRLERELCCDRLVVERVGQPIAYAEMLAYQAGTTHRGRSAALAMADRQVMTRIRRLLYQEERSMKLTIPEGLGLLGAVVVGALLVLGSQAAPPQTVSNSKEIIHSAPGTAVVDVKDMPALEALLPSEQGIRNDTGTTIRPLPHVPPRNTRSITISRRDVRRLEIVQLPTRPDGVVTYNCRGGIKIVCKSQKFGTICLEADEAVITRVERQRDENPAKAPNGETWIDEAALPMEVSLRGDVIFCKDVDKTAGKGDQWTIRAPELEYDFVTGRVVAPHLEPPVVVARPETPIADAISSTARQLLTVLQGSQRTTSLFPRSAQPLQIRQFPETNRGVVTYVCQGGIMIVSKSPKLGTLRLEADEAVIVRYLHNSKGETVAGPNGATWVEEDETDMEVSLRGDVIFRQDEAKIAGKGDQRTIRARELEFDFVEDSLVALDARLEVAGSLIASPRIEQFHPRVRQPDGSLAPSERREIRSERVR